MAGLVFWFQDFDKDVFSSRPTIDLDAWRYGGKVGNITKYRCLNETDTSLNGGTLDFQIIGSTPQDFQTWMSENATENTLIFDTQWTCPEGAVSLDSISHANVDWYVYGSANGFTDTGTNFPGQFVYLPQSGQGACHAVHVNTAVMFDRWKELG